MWYIGYISSFYISLIIMAQHRSPMTIYFKSRDNLVLPVYSQQSLKNQKSDNLLRQCNRMLYICVILDKFYPFKCQLFEWHHIKVPWPFISEVRTACLAGLLQLYRASKSPKAKFCCGKVTRCIPCVVYLVYLILLHVIDYNGIWQKPHDPLFQKSRQLG